MFGDFGRCMTFALMSSIFTLGDGESKMKNPSAIRLWRTMLTNHAPGE